MIKGMAVAAFITLIVVAYAVQPEAQPSSFPFSPSSIQLTADPAQERIRRATERIANILEHKPEYAPAPVKIPADTTQDQIANAVERIADALEK